MDPDPTPIPIGSVTAEAEVPGGKIVYVDVEATASKDSEKAAVLEFEALDEDGNNLPIPECGHSSAFINYRYIASASRGYRHSQFIITMPTSSRLLRIYGRDFSKVKGTALSGPPIINFQGCPNATLTTPLGKHIDVPVEAFQSEIECPDDANSVDLLFRLSADKTTGGKNPLSIRLLAHDGSELLPPDSLGISESVGSYTYLSVPEGQSSAEKSISLPLDPNVAKIAMSGNPWNAPEVKLSSPPEISWNKGDTIHSLEDFLREIPTSATFIVVDTTAPPMGDDTRALRPNNMVTSLTKLGYYILFFPFTSIGDQPHRPDPQVFQLNRQYFDEAIQTVCRMREGLENIYACSSFPSLSANAALDYLSSAGWRTLYVVRDDMEEFNRAGYSQWYNAALERRVIERAEQIITVSPALAQKIDSLVPGARAKTAVVPNAVRPEIVDNARHLRSAEQWNQRGATVGYVGHLTPSWFDWRLVTRAATRMPDVTFQLIGHGIPLGLSTPPNVECIGPKNHTELLEFVADWRVGIIPFLPSPLSRGVDPNKLFEYIAWGLRTVSAPMGSVSDSPSTTVYRTADEFCEQISAAIESPMTDNEMSLLEEYCRHNTWDDRANYYASTFKGQR